MMIFQQTMRTPTPHVAILFMSYAARAAGRVTIALVLLIGQRRAAGQGVSAMEPSLVLCPVDEENIQPLALGRAVLGSSACYGCHLQGTAAYAAVDPEVTRIVGAEFLRRSVPDNWVLGNEWRTWAARDRHAQAYTTLLGERSKRIGKNLGIAEVHRDARCLACHSSIPAASVRREGFAVDDALFRRDHVDERVSLGVNCEACHGAAGANQQGGRAGWVDVHVARQTWRFRAPGEKQSEFGFYDVRTPSSRMSMCLSCHLGDVKQGRLVTHAMYAAGHPPLPSFELKSFADMMPPHWRSLGSGETAEPNAADPQTLRGAKPKRITAEFLERTADPYVSNLRTNHRGYFDAIIANYPASYSGMRSVAVGVLVAWRKNAELTSELISKQEFPLIEHEGRWPELSQFECSACHHELQDSNWRRERVAGDIPGRPLLRDWSTPLCRTILRGLAPESVKEFDERQRQIKVAAAAQPFGDAAELAKQLEAAAAWLDAIVRDIESRPLTREDALAVLRSMAAVGGEELLDYDAARELTWGFQAVLEELDPSKAWAEPRSQFATIQQRFALDLATINVRQERKFDIAGGGQRSADEIVLSALLPAMANHSASAVRELYARLAEAIAADPP